MATVLIGYDVEFSAIGENMCRAGLLMFYPELPDDTTARGLDIISRNHHEFGVRGTLFVCGRTLLHSLPALSKARDDDLFEIQQHTYSHVLFKPDAWEGGVFKPSPPEALLHEVSATSALLGEHLGVECYGLRTPHGYHLGLSDRPDLVDLLAQAGMRYVSSWGRNENNGQPTPFSVQPFWYHEQGHPDILELPFQYWLDGTWFEQNGPERGKEFLQVLRAGIDEIADTDLVYGACFHDWAMLRYREEETGWARGFMAYALEAGVEVMSYGDYYRRLTGGGAG
jgi:peptidoglycan/xylan/chitin deacetylase (PgdA/CDA1 family)